LADDAALSALERFEIRHAAVEVDRGRHEREHQSRPPLQFSTKAKEARVRGRASRRGGERCPVC
jgi:hypothetical protein